MLGFYHEHSRTDSRHHVDILWDEITRAEQEDFYPHYKKNYIECTTCSTYGEYDLLSIMHYPSVLGMKNRTVIRPKPGLYSQDEINAMGQRTGLSPLDVEDIQKFYECGNFMQSFIIFHIW